MGKMLQSIMLNKLPSAIVIFICLALTACSSRPDTLPTPLPSYTPRSTATFPVTETAVPTLTPEKLETPTIIPTATPLPVCSSNEVVESPSNGSLPSYVDVLKVSTKLSGSNLSVTFTMNWLPDQIMIDRNILPYGATEIAWGVAIDTDNDPNTGSAIPHTNSGYGYEYILQAVNFKEGDELQGDIQTLFSDKTNVWEMFPDGSNTIQTPGKIKVDTATASLTLSGNIKGITKNSYLHFFAVYFPTASQQMTDELCKR